MKLTRHNGRSGQNGVYNPKHNDRRFDVERSEHIDPKMTELNVYWDCFQGFHYAKDREQADQIVRSFEEIEALYYWEHYEDSCVAQNERNQKTGHPERNRTPDDLRQDKRTCPEETVLQIGKLEEHISGRMLQLIARDFFEEFEKRFGKHVHILDWSLHMDEGTPHIHERHVFDCPNRYGEIYPQQEKALEALGIEMPHPDKKKGKTNNRKVTFDAICRDMLFNIAKQYELYLDEEPEYGGRSHLEKQDYIMMKQKEVISEKEGELKAIEKKLFDVDYDVTETEIRLRKRKKMLAETIEEFDEACRKASEAEVELEVTEAKARSAKADLEKAESETRSAKAELEKAEEETSSAKADLEWIRRKTREEEKKLEEVQAKTRELTALSARMKNTEEFARELADKAYEKAVECVTEKVVEETHNKDFEIIERFREKVKTKLPYDFNIRKKAYELMTLLMGEFQGMTRTITDRIRSLFAEGSVSEHIKGTTMEYIHEWLEYGPTMPDTEEPEVEKQEPQVIRRHRSR